MPDIKYRDAIKQAASLKKLGMTELYLMDDGEEKPWGDVVKAEPGESHRLGMNTSIWFTAEDPKTKLRFCWSFDIEKRSANGKGHYEIDIEGCKAAYKKLSATGKAMLASYFAGCAAKVREKGLEWQGYADRQRQDAETLDQLAACRWC